MADLMTLLQKLGDGEIDDLSSAYAEACFYADDAMDEIVTLREKVVELESKIAELEAKLERVRKLPEMWRKSSFAAHRPACDFIEHICADELDEALADD